ncbi:type IV secretion protein Rhs [Serratia rubidaea]|uniref:type IV secretion protein Rhs n=1 Tax=Serratia rubidaea TaxID=61652 RepID=UPI0020133F48|nr:type IV secretion protein Rhs [Serratia rubidaea]
MMQREEGRLRLLTLREVALAKTVFGGSIDYPRVWVHCDSYLPFGLQRSGTAMAPNGELYFRKELYMPDFAALHVTTEIKHLFIHEMMHVWQHQRGMWVRTRGLLSWATSYSYMLDGKPMLKYSLEQQAQIVADYYVLKTYGVDEWDIQRRKPRPVVTYRGRPDRRTIGGKYRATLARFP